MQSMSFNGIGSALLYEPKESCSHLKHCRQRERVDLSHCRTPRHLNLVWMYDEATLKWRNEDIYVLFRHQSDWCRLHTSMESMGSKSSNSFKQINICLKPESAILGNSKNKTTPTETEGTNLTLLPDSPKRPMKLRKYCSFIILFWLQRYFMVKYV